MHTQDFSQKIEDFYYKQFFKKDKVKVLKKSNNNLSYIESFYGIKLPKELATYVSFPDYYNVNNHSFIGGEYTRYYNADYCSMLLSKKDTKGNSFENLIEKDSILFSSNLFLALINALPIASDGSGDLYIAAINPNNEKTEIFFLPQIGSGIRFLSNSLPSFVYLSYVTDKLENYMDKNDIEDPEDIDIKDVPDIKKDLVALKKHINLSTDDSVDTNLDYAFVLIDAETTLKPKSSIITLWERFKWLADFFNSGSSFPGVYNEHYHSLASFKKDMKNTAIKDIAGVKVYWLWVCLLFNYEKELNQLIQQYINDKSILVLDTIKLIKEIQKGRKQVSWIKNIDTIKSKIHSFSKDIQAKKLAEIEASKKNMDDTPIKEIPK